MQAQQTATERSAEERRARPPHSRELQRLWYVLDRRRWTSLGLVPAHPGGSVRGAARALVEVGLACGGRPLRLIDAAGLVPGSTPALLSELAGHASRGERVVIALESPLSTPAVLPVADALDSLLLCVALGQSELAAARRTLEVIGRERFTGGVALPPGEEER